MSILIDTCAAVVTELERLDPASLIAARARGVLSAIGAAPVGARYQAGRRGRLPLVKHDDRVAELYLSGMSIAAISADIGIATSTVSGALARKGVAARATGASQKAGLSQGSQARVERIRSMRAVGKTLEDIGAAEGITRERVRQLCLKAGIDTKRRELTPAERQMAADYLAGQSLDAVACSHRVSQDIVKRVLFQAGHKPRPCKKHKQRESRTIANAERAAQLYGAGKTGREIAAELGINNEAGVYRLLNIAGCPRTRRPTAAEQAA